MSEVVVVAVVKAKPGRESELERELRKLIVPTHAEPGCILYALHRSTSDPCELVFVERWRSRDDLDAHMKAPHLQHLPALAELLAEPMRAYVLEALPGGDPGKGAL